MSQDRILNSDGNDFSNNSFTDYQAPNIDATLSNVAKTFEKNRITHGVHEGYHDLSGKTVGYARKSLREVFNIPGDAEVFITGTSESGKKFLAESVGDDFVIEEGLSVEFLKTSGTKGVFSSLKRFLY